MEILLRDTRFAVRTLVQRPLFALTVVIVLGLGIGANAAIFTLCEQILFRSLPVHQPGELVNLTAPGPIPGQQSTTQAGGWSSIFSYPMFRDLEATQEVFTGIAGHCLFTANLSRGEQRLSGDGVFVSGSYFQVLGLRPTIGRLIAPGDDQTIGGDRVAVLGYDYWANRLGADSTILGQIVGVNGHSMTVVGVAPRGFRGTTIGVHPDVYVPISMRSLLIPDREGFQNRRSYWVYLFARLMPGVSVEQAAADIQHVYRAILNDVEAPLQEGIDAETMTRFRTKQIVLEDGRRGQSFLIGDARTPLLFLLLAVGIVLVIACANITNLLLTRGASRGVEMAVRSSLGASRARLLAQCLTESLLLAAAGGAVGLLGATWTLAIIGPFLPPEIAASTDLGFRSPVVFFVGGQSVLTVLLFGLFPALNSTKPNLVGTLRAAAGQGTGTRGAALFRSTLASVQVGLSVALLMAAGLFTKSLINVSQVDLGVNPDNVITFRISPSRNGYEPSASMALYEALEENLSNTPGVTGLSSAVMPLFTGGSWSTGISVEGFLNPPGTDNNSRVNQVGTGYFETLGIPFVAGRDFAMADNGESRRVAIINLAFARKFGLNPQDAIGKHMDWGRTDDLGMEIIGVVRDSKYSDVKRSNPPTFFIPYRQHWSGGPGALTFYVRTGVQSSSFRRTITAVVGRLDPDLAVENLRTLKDQVSESHAMDTMMGLLAGSFAALATLLAAVGLHGVLAYSVSQRIREFGIMMALGAQGTRVRRMVLLELGRLTLIGGTLGIVAALILGRGAQSMLFGLASNDPMVVILAAALVTTVSLGAGYAPALRASRLDPIKVLREE
jgi:predicted permease